MLIGKRVYLLVYIGRDMSLGRSYILNNRDEYEKLSDNEYLSLLPLSNWIRETINGKHLKGIISTIVYLKIRKALFSTGISMSKLFGRVSSLMFTRKKDCSVIVGEANRLKTVGIKISSSLDRKELVESCLLRSKKENQK